MSRLAVTNHLPTARTDVTLDSVCQSLRVVFKKSAHRFGCVPEEVAELVAGCAFRVEPGMVRLARADCGAMLGEEKRSRELPSSLRMTALTHCPRLD